MPRVFHIGDKIKFLNDVGGGVIVRFQDDETAIVLRPDGFEVPHLLAEIIHDGSGKDIPEKAPRQPSEEYGPPPDGEGRQNNRSPKSVDRPGMGPQEKAHPRPESSRSPSGARDVEEVDLHIHTLVDHPGNHTSGELVDMQLARFEMAIEGAIRHGQKRIIFIHGTGSGMLKWRMRRILDEKYPKLQYQDASFREYGYGATLVLLKR